MVIRQDIYILSFITREMGKLKTHSPTYCIMDNWENMPYLTRTLDKIYLTGILKVQRLQISWQWLVFALKVPRYNQHCACLWPRTIRYYGICMHIDYYKFGSNWMVNAWDMMTSVNMIAADCLSHIWHQRIWHVGYLVGWWVPTRNASLLCRVSSQLTKSPNHLKMNRS